MLRRIRLRELGRLARRDLPAPVDVLNLIRASDDRRFERYRWYGLLVLPAMLAAGGRVRWMARHERSLLGEPQADKLLVVRYPSHRRFLAMTLNPYYLAINRLREAGIDAFEASFTQPSVPGNGLRAHDRLVAAHFDGDLDGVAEAMPGELVYASSESATMTFLRDPRSTDPRPLTYPQVAFFAGGDGDLEADRLDALRSAAERISVQVYRREPMRAYRPRVLR